MAAGVTSRKIDVRIRTSLHSSIYLVVSATCKDRRFEKSSARNFGINIPYLEKRVRKKRQRTDEPHQKNREKSRTISGTFGRVSQWQHTRQTPYFAVLGPALVRLSCGCRMLKLRSRQGVGNTKSCKPVVHIVTRPFSSPSLS